MAILEMNYKSASLKRYVKVKIVLPFENSDFSYDEKGTRYKTLVLLHGYTENEDIWINESPIVREARHRKLAVLMPAGENSFYHDYDVLNGKYETFIGEELLEICRNNFPLSEKKEDTYIACSSMGGYGAMHIGLKHSETFSKIVSFSGGFLKYIDEDTRNLLRASDPGTYDRIYDLFDKEAREDSLEGLLERKTEQKILLLCGKKDPLILVNRRMEEYLKENEIDHIYKEGEGAHDFDYWSSELPYVLDYLLEE